MNKPDDTKSEIFKNYPFWIVLLSNTVSLSIYTTGFLIMCELRWGIAILYSIFVLLQEYRVVRFHCVDCFYWGKTCGFGKGRISAFLFKKGDASRFCNKDITWLNMLPDLLISLVPFVIGIILIIIKFDLRILIPILLLLGFTTVGNSLIPADLPVNSAYKENWVARRTNFLINAHNRVLSLLCYYLLFNTVMKQ